MDQNRTVTPEIAVNVLAKYGEKVTLEEAELILDFMYNLGKLAIEQYITDEEG